MTIKRGEDWGERVILPGDAVDVTSDADAVEQLAAGRTVRLCGGDVWTSLGAQTRRDGAMRLPIDLLRVEADGRRFVAIAHVVARRSWWRGLILAVMNGDRLGGWDVAPRAHPDDGRADVVEVDPAMSVRARWQAWRRLPTGTHLPHPLLHNRRITAESWAFDRPLRLWVDGVARGTVRSLCVAVEPDGAVVHT
jgi:YegS C-terminal NAD kinase beta sandwich-like domain